MYISLSPFFLFLLSFQMNAENNQNLNPISRLVQIQQGKKEQEPEYTMLLERSLPLNRHEFVMQVSLMDSTVGMYWGSPAFILFIYSRNWNFTVSLLWASWEACIWYCIFNLTYIFRASLIFLHFATHWKAKVGEEAATGSGLLKKVAKRNAAEAMLVKLGYKPSLQLSEAKVRLKWYEEQFIYLLLFAAILRDSVV